MRNARALGYGLLPLVSSLLLGMGAAQAQTPFDEAAAAQQAERLQRETEERIRRQREQDLQSQQPPARLELPAQERRRRVSETCRDIRTVSIEGVNLLKPDRVHAIAAAYEGRCLGVAEIENLLADVTAAYIRKGYAAARAYLPAQDLATGTLRVEVEEGRVERIVIEDGGANSINVATVAPFVEGAPLNLRDLEQALDQINRLGSNRAQLDILPGSEPGASVVQFSNQPSRRLRAGVSFDNHGQKATEKHQLGANLGLDNPLGLNDFISVTHRRSQPYDGQRKGTYLTNISYVVPFGYSTVSLSGSRSRYNSVITPTTEEYRTYGDSRTYTGRVDHVLVRGQTTQWRMSGMLTNKIAENYLAGALLDVSSRELTVLDIDTSLSTRFQGGAFHMDFGVARGTPMFGSMEDPAGLPVDAPRAEFLKFKYGLGYFRPFAFASRDWSWNAQFSGQHANDVLYGSEQFSIGSLYTVRGFGEDSLSGDHGHYLRNDLSVNQPVVLPGGRDALLRPYIGLDHGKVWGRKVGSFTGKLTSASVGFSFYYRNVSFDLVHAHPIDKPEFNRDLDGSTYFSLSLSI